ncbi:MAG: hypothetical protein ABIG66_00480 [Candidatus Kerfeldbacteria bacterium]
MRILVDFDYTLFNTEAMRRALIAVLEPFGVDENTYRSTEQEAKLDGVYHLTEHVRLLVGGDKQGEALEKMKAVVDNAGEFLYPDALPFLKDHSEHDVTVLSFGLPEWQERKIAGAGIDELVDEVVATEQSKEEIVKQWEGEDVVFINDRGSEIDAMHAVLPNAKYVWLRRDGAPYRDEPCASSGLEATNLSIDLNSL